MFHFHLLHFLILAAYGILVPRPPFSDVLLGVQYEQKFSLADLDMVIRRGIDVRGNTDSLILVVAAPSQAMEFLRNDQDFQLSDGQRPVAVLRWIDLPETVDNGRRLLVFEKQPVHLLLQSNDVSLTHEWSDYVVFQDFRYIVMSVPPEKVAATQDALSSKTVVGFPLAGSSMRVQDLLIPSLIDEEIEYDPVISKLLDKVDKYKLNATIHHLSSYETRFSFSTEVRDVTKWLVTQYRSLGLVPIEHAYDPKYPSNIIVRLPANVKPSSTSETKKSRVILMGAHYDSYAEDGPRSPGADDDGSGTAAVLEMARIVTHASRHGHFQHEHDILFCAFSGEEQGLVGSEHFAKVLRGLVDDVDNKLTKPFKKMFPDGVRVSAVLNADMLGYHLPGTEITLGMKNRYVTPALVNKVTKIAQLYIEDLVVSPSSSCCSDYMSFYKAGFASVGYFESAATASANPNYHRSTDSPETLDYDQMQKLTRAILSAILTLAKK